MPRITLVRYTTKPGRGDENESLSRAVFAELDRTKPAGVAYALFRDGADFVHLFVNLKEDDSAVVTELPTFKAFGTNQSERLVDAPDVMRLNPSLVASYGFDKALAPA
jgi:hypothetical protein